MTGRKPLGLGVIGLGRAFTLMVPTFIRDPRIRLVAAMDPREPARRMFNRDFDAPTFDTVTAMCENPEVELVYIASPHQYHAQHVRQVANAGKHILVEKPLAITLTECTEIVNSVDSTGIVLVVGHSHSFDGPVLHAWRLLQEQCFGATRMIHAFNYTNFLYRPRRPEELDTQQGGGVVLSQGAHQVDIVRLLGGGDVATIHAHTGAWDPHRPTEGAYTALLTFTNGVFASITYSGYAHYDSDEIFGGIGELGTRKHPDDYGAARKRLSNISDIAQEADLKASGNYGGCHYKPETFTPPPYHQHFGHMLVSTDKADLRLTPEGVHVYGDERQFLLDTPKSDIPRVEVIDELWGAIRENEPVLHSAKWARATTEVCLAILKAARQGHVVRPQFQAPYP
ncbi:Gfo/Idh/MocA family oxidoreductase [Alcaligenaceae bacterium CGII-47]|nr:Gfo/Idh/MocA family oxidoreductase [Alcaligenaceae bacterium CGII-47]